ncbi:hypothetical protein D8Z79_025950 (plasmid) [Escherichia fergusonii]|uniref:Uncharacterized protein n=1 Tax=Lysinibacillus pakistanensis TaxID=759811 RepID=A0ABX6DL25_9BACI|nr:hypothetical protein D8Z79_025950 [Escherichia fergusonii]QGG54160.1 hypothetical protein GDS87_24570 [Lysinibacillus pakistanensis]
MPFDSYYQLAIRTSGDIWLDYNPVSTFWVDNELIGGEDVDFITLTYKDNEALPSTIVKEIESAKEKAKTSSYWANWWKVYGLGQIGSLEGFVFRTGKRLEHYQKRQGYYVTAKTLDILTTHLA